MQMGEKYSSFKKTHGPPNYQWNPRYVPLEHNDYLKTRNIPLSEVRMFEPKVRFEDPHHHWVYDIVKKKYHDLHLVEAMLLDFLFNLKASKRKY